MNKELEGRILNYLDFAKKMFDVYLEVEHTLDNQGIRPYIENKEKMKEALEEESKMDEIEIRKNRFLPLHLQHNFKSMKDVFDKMGIDIGETGTYDIHTGEITLKANAGEKDLLISFDSRYEGNYDCDINMVFKNSYEHQNPERGEIIKKNKENILKTFGIEEQEETVRIYVIDEHHITVFEERLAFGFDERDFNEIRFEYNSEEKRMEGLCKSYLYNKSEKNDFAVVDGSLIEIEEPEETEEDNLD